MKTIELEVQIFFQDKKARLLHYEWLGLKNQAKRVRVWVELDEEII